MTELAASSSSLSQLLTATSHPNKSSKNTPDTNVLYAIQSMVYKERAY